MGSCGINQQEPHRERGPQALLLWGTSLGSALLLGVGFILRLVLRWFPGTRCHTHK